MSDDKDTDKKDRIDVIISYLKMQGDALATIDRRMESFGANLKAINESVQAITKRQAELERGSAERLGSCREIMNRLANRVFAIETRVTPLPKKFDPGDFEAFTEGAANIDDDGDNGAEKDSEEDNMMVDALMKFRMSGGGK